MAIYDVVSFESTGTDWLLYKFNGTEFNTKSKLIVSTGQVAILVHNGKIEKICEEGKYVLNTELLPFVKEFVKAFHGGNNPYPMEIYFINKRLKLDLLWGTADPVTMLDQIYNIQINIRARGQIGIRLSNYQFFFENLIGSLLKNNYITFMMITNFFRGVINQKVKKIISSYLIENKISFFEVNAHLDKIQSLIEEEVKQEINQYGFDMVTLSVESINVPNEDLDKLNDILHKKAEYTQLGENVYRTARGYDVLEAGAKNNSTAGAFIGVGMGSDIAGNAKGNSIIPPMQNQTKTIKCPKCGNDVSFEDKFCPNCGTKLDKFCPKCGGEVKPGQKFCPNCGEKIGE